MKFSTDRIGQFNSQQRPSDLPRNITALTEVNTSAQTKSSNGETSNKVSDRHRYADEYTNADRWTYICQKEQKSTKCECHVPILRAYTTGRPSYFLLTLPGVPGALRHFSPGASRGN